MGQATNRRSTLNSRLRVLSRNVFGYGGIVLMWLGVAAMVVWGQFLLFRFTDDRDMAPLVNLAMPAVALLALAAISVGLNTEFAAPQWHFRAARRFGVTAAVVGAILFLCSMVLYVWLFSNAWARDREIGLLGRPIRVLDMQGAAMWASWVLLICGISAALARGRRCGVSGGN